LIPPFGGSIPPAPAKPQSNELNSLQKRLLPSAFIIHEIGSRHNKSIATPSLIRCSI
jgi:hypothetical protein